MRQHIVDKGIIVAAGPQKFLKIQREHFVIGLVTDTVALNFAVVNAEHGTAANDVEPAVDLEEFERGRNVGKLLQFIEENQGFALNKPLRRVDARDIFDDIRRFVAVCGYHFVLWLLHEVDRDNARVAALGKAPNGFGLADLPRPFDDKRFFIRICFPFRQKSVDFAF